MTPVDQLHLTLDGHSMDVLACKRDLADFLNRHSLADPLVIDSLLVAEEILINIVEYGELDEDTATIHFTCVVEGDGVQMTFEDAGKPFDPTREIQPADLEADDIARGDGGFGFVIVKEIADRLEYLRRDGNNFLSVTLSSHCVRHESTN